MGSYLQIQFTFIRLGERWALKTHFALKIASKRRTWQTVAWKKIHERLVKIGRHGVFPQPTLINRSLR